MTTLLIEYDLSKPGQDYPGLIDYIKSTGTWANHLKSAWMVRTTMTPAELRDKLGTFLDSNDKLMVIDVTGDSAAWRGLPSSTTEWIQSYL